MAIEPLETAHGSDYPGCQQLSVFLESRIGQLLQLTRVFDGLDVHILGLMVDSSVDCAIVRMVVDDPETAHRALRDNGFAVSVSDVLVVELPHGERGIMAVCRALLGGEININYVYPLIARGEHPACLAIHVDGPATGAATLVRHSFNVLDQSDL
jgi:hypothetical protein